MSGTLQRARESESQAFPLGQRYVTTRVLVVAVTVAAGLSARRGRDALPLPR
jgi:hypothetical protein